MPKSKESLLKEKTEKIPREYMNISISNGRVVITDYSIENDYKLLLAGMKSAGIEVDVKSDSWCG